MKAVMRVLGDTEQPLELLQDNPPLFDVPGFGILGLKRDGDAWLAAVFQPPSTEPRHRDLTVADDGRLVIPMLHKGDRLDVVVDVS